MAKFVCHSVCVCLCACVCVFVCVCMEQLLLMINDFMFLAIMLFYLRRSTLQNQQSVSDYMNLWHIHSYELMYLVMVSWIDI